MLNILRKLWNDLIGVLLPRTCIVCGRPLVPMEEVCCTTCTLDMPLTNYKAADGNPIERIFWGKAPIVRATAFMKYQPNTPYARIITQLKYNNRPDIGIYLGRLMAKDLLNTKFFENIDLIIPLPLARSRQFTRGYNQSECIAKGIQQITQIPIDTTSVKRSKANKKQTQTHKHLRHENVKGIFSLTHTVKTKNPIAPTPLENLLPNTYTNDTQNTLPHPLTNKHILLIDDIFTTGATLLSCSQALSTIPGIRISILCAGVAGQHRWGAQLPEECKP